MLFVVIAVGVLGARVRVRRMSFGVASVLFAGLALGAIDSKLALPQEVWILGLVVFGYTIGLSSGPAFVGTLRRRGLATNALTIAVLGAAAGATLLVHLAAGAARAAVAGSFAGGSSAQGRPGRTAQRMSHRPGGRGRGINHLGRNEPESP